MSTSGSTSARSSVRVRYAPLGAARELFHRHDAELVLSGPAGTGKSRACLEKLHLQASRRGRMRGLIVRKTLASLTSTGLVTYCEKVLHPLDGVRFFGGGKERPAQFEYDNGSVLVVGGLDRPSKVMSSEYDAIFVQEATEATEHDWESLTTRLRNGVLPYQQLMADCNPDAPTHWLRKRADRGVTAMLESRHEDNPRLWDRARGAWTEPGARYIAVLDALTGVRKERLRFGRWVAAEGLVYEGWDRAIHLVERIPGDGQRDARGVPLEWPRYWAVDFGFTNPFVWQEWRADPDGRLYRTREIYRTQRLVEDHARDIARVVRRDLGLEADGPLPVEARPRVLVVDHDAEDRATLERHLGIGTTAAHTAVSPGIQAVAARLRPAGDGRPRLLLLRDALVERDPLLEERRLPACTEDEIDGYVWDTSAGRRRGEQPVKANDHGLDATRYLVAQRDLVGDVGYLLSPWD